MMQKTINLRKAFTMIEVLAVIAIIGTLAALVIGGAGAAGAARMKARAKAELATLESVIEAYQNDQGFYPPGGLKPELPPLYYELSGTVRFDDGAYSTLAGGVNEKLTGAEIKDVFGRDGFANSNPETAKRYFSSLKPGQHAAVKNTLGANVRVLVIPIEGPKTPEVLSKEDNTQRLNTWRYVSNNPTNNPASFDLWVDIIVRGETNTIGNWKE